MECYSINTNIFQWASVILAYVWNCLQMHKQNRILLRDSLDKCPNFTPDYVHGVKQREGLKVSFLWVNTLTLVYLEVWFRIIPPVSEFQFFLETFLNAGDILEMTRVFLEWYFWKTFFYETWIQEVPFDFFPLEVPRKLRWAHYWIVSSFLLSLLLASLLPHSSARDVHI